MNIPKTTLIDRKTGEVIENKLHVRNDYSIEHVEDRDIVQRLNRLLI